MNLKYLYSKLIKKIQIPALKDSQVDSTSKVCSSSQLVNVKMNRYSYIGNYCTIINSDIGSFCSIADNCIIGGASHPVDWVSTSPVFYEGKNVLKKNFSTHEYNPFKQTIIGNDVWIGNNCLIKSGVVISDGAVIGMGSVVTKNIGPYEIWAGNPAKLIKKRFDNEKIEKINQVKWWTWEKNELSHFAKYFNSVDELFRQNQKKNK